MAKAAIIVSKRLQPVALAFLCLMAVQLVTAILAGEGQAAPPSAVRVTIAAAPL